MTTPLSTKERTRGPELRARAALRDVVAYNMDRAPCAIELDNNTNVFGVPPAALRVLRAADADDVSRYPGLYSGALRHALANYVGVAEREILTGCGSDDVIDSTMRAFAEPGESVVYSEPTFSMIPYFAKVNGLIPIRVAFRPDYDIDAEAVLATGARITYLCSPNNPTGALASRAAVERVLERAQGVVILDEAYVEFSGGSLVAVAPGHGRLIVARTLSKAFGLAGLRLGYGVGATALLAEVEKARGPYTVSGLSERAAAAAVTEDQAWMRACVDEAVASRDRFIDALRHAGFTPLPSATNFVLVPLENAATVAARLRDVGIAVRPFARLRNIGDALRISIGPRDVMEHVLSSLREACR